MDTNTIGTVSISEQSVEKTEKAIEDIDIKTLDLFKGFKVHDETALRKSNAYYAIYWEDGYIKNLAWSSDLILNTYEEPLRDKIQEGLVSMNLLEVEVRWF